MLFKLLEEDTQCKQFYDNVGEYIHQYNDMVRDFHLHLSDSNMQNAATTTSNIYTLLARMFEKKQMIRGGTMWYQIDGSSNHYRFSLPTI